MRLRRALVVNCSAPAYNLGAAKLARWLHAAGWAVTRAAGDPGLFAYGYDLVALSVIFSWHAPIARDIALRVQGQSEVWCGGPGVFAPGVRTWWQQQTGLTVRRGLDARFEHAPGIYALVFASRGCPVGCNFCIVPTLEGLQQQLHWDFQPAPVLADNNLSALPIAFQEHIIARYRETGVPLVDANSGFEPRTFDEGTYRRWRPILRGPWRSAFDEQAERAEVAALMTLLAREVPKRKRVYVLVGNEPLESCYDRVLQVLAWGGEPYCQYVLPLNWLGDPATLHARYDWTYDRGRAFARYVNRYGWRTFPVAAYQPRAPEPPPFAGTSLDLPVWRARWAAALADYHTFHHRASQAMTAS